MWLASKLGQGYLIFSFTNLSQNIFLQSVGRKRKHIKGFFPDFLFLQLEFKIEEKAANYLN